MSLFVDFVYPLIHTASYSHLFISNTKTSRMRHAMQFNANFAGIINHPYISTNSNEYVSHSMCATCECVIFQLCSALHVSFIDIFHCLVHKDRCESSLIMRSVDGNISQTISIHYPSNMDDCHEVVVKQLSGLTVMANIYLYS